MHHRVFTGPVGTHLQAEVEGDLEVAIATLAKEQQSTGAPAEDSDVASPAAATATKARTNAVLDSESETEPAAQPGLMIELPSLCCNFPMLRCCLVKLQHELGQHCVTVSIMQAVYSRHKHTFNLVCGVFCSISDCSRFVRSDVLRWPG